jgi:hypothetical protein
VSPFFKGQTLIKLLQDALRSTKSLGICGKCLCEKYDTNGAIHCGCGLTFTERRENVYEPKKPKDKSIFGTYKIADSLDFHKGAGQPLEPRKIHKDKRKEANKRACRGKNPE